MDSLTASILAALAGVVLTLGLIEVAFSSRRRTDPSSPWIAGWCLAVVLYLIGRHIETLHDAELGARLRFLAATPMAGLAIGVVRARARQPLARGALGWLAGGTAATMLFTWLVPLQLVVALTGVAIVALWAFSVITLWRSKLLLPASRTVSLLVVAFVGATALNDILLQLGLIRSVHLVELALVSLPLLHNYRLVRNVHELNLTLESAVRWRTDRLLRRTRELEQAMAEARFARDQAEQSRRQLEHAERLASLGTMAAGVAHEINNPLAYVLGNLDLLADELPAEGELAELVADSIEGAQRVKHIVRDLMAFSATTSNHTDLLDLDDSVEAALNMLGALIRPRATVERVRGPAPKVRANPVRLGQVLMNLMRNAAEALPVGNDHNRITVVTGTTASGDAFVTIADNGPGIPPDVLPRIFEPFFTTKPVGAGTGLGLSICHGIVNAMGWRLDVDSPPGEGATFTLQLTAPVVVDAGEPPSAQILRAGRHAERDRATVARDPDPTTVKSGHAPRM